MREYIIHLIVIVTAVACNQILCLFVVLIKSHGRCCIRHDAGLRPSRDKLAHLDEVAGSCMTITAFHCACEKGCSEMVECLLAARADTDKATKYDYTPLIYAASEGHVEVVQLLLSAEADTEKAECMSESTRSSKGLNLPSGQFRFIHYS